MLYPFVCLFRFAFYLKALFQTLSAMHPALLSALKGQNDQEGKIFLVLQYIAKYIKLRVAHDFQCFLI